VRSIRTLTAIGALAILAADGCAGAKDFRFRLFDPTGHVPAEVATADILRSAARAYPEPGGSAALFVQLTPRGASEFHALTRGLARRGARLHRRQSFVVTIDGHVYARPFVDYKASPDGLDGRSGLELQGLKLATARRLAKEIRGH
jgi:hypothetical protein